MGADAGTPHLPARLGVVLAGGRATRMGGDKAGALLAGRPLLAHAVEAVRAAGLDPRVSMRGTTRFPPIPGLATDQVWREPDTGADSSHPLAGLAHALGAAGAPVVTLPVDLPLLPPAVLAALAAHPEPLAVLGLDGRPAALVARVAPEHAAALAEAGAAGAPALRTLLALGAVVIDLAELAPGADPGRALFNVNTPADLDRATALLTEPKP